MSDQWLDKQNARWRWLGKYRAPDHTPKNQVNHMTVKVRRLENEYRKLDFELQALRKRKGSILETHKSFRTMGQLERLAMIQEDIDRKEKQIVTKRRLAKDLITKIRLLSPLPKPPKSLFLKDQL